MNRRVAAVTTLVLLAGVVVLAVILAASDFPQGLPVVGAVAGAVVAGWDALLHAGVRRRLAVAAALALLAGALALIAVNDRVLEDALLVAGGVLALSAARAAFAVRAELRPAPAPQRPVLFWNPRSGGGKAPRLHLPDEARARGIDPIELEPGLDLEIMARDAIAAGADALAVAGGDGTQAVVARIAAQHGLPYACIPAGTRNHFALDLGVDRDDVVGALDAFVDGGERRVDLATVNGRVFVNNVSLGTYADALLRAEYRDAKLRTIARTASGVDDPKVMLISNNPYRLGPGVGSGTRPRLDGGVLGVAVLGSDASSGDGRRLWRQWSTPTFEASADQPVNAGVDGEAIVIDPPLRFSSWPSALRVRIARAHPGASPSAGVPQGGWKAIRALVEIAEGRSPPSAAPTARPRAGPPQPVVATPLPDQSERPRVTLTRSPEALDGHRGTAGEDDVVP